MFWGEEIFKDRADAGRRLAGSLARYRNEGPTILALPRGGVPVGYEISRSLGAPLDVIVARKLGAPDQPELGIGAVAPDGVRILNTAAVRAIGISKDYLDKITRKETAEMKRRLRHFRGGRPELEIRGRTAILVDDGLATGVTARAAIETLRRRNPKRVVLAVPICAAPTAAWIRNEVDDLVSLKTPPELGAIGLWYRNFDQTSDAEVVRLLEDARRTIG
ncbi:MAG: phosphoribosyltransferase [Rubrobacter sp.]|jgi:predicted phosphoribosyltransferase|nr:phosphoribosyltransferase [Rubrobacter sp.]